MRTIISQVRKGISRKKFKKMTSNQMTTGKKTRKNNPRKKRRMASKKLEMKSKKKEARNLISKAATNSKTKTHKRQEKR